MFTGVESRSLMEQQRLQYLLEHYRLGTLSPADRQELFALTQQADNEALLLQLSYIIKATADQEPVPANTDLAPLLHSILAVDKTPSIPGTNQPLIIKRARLAGRWYRVAAAAAVLILAGGSYYYYVQRHTANPIQTAALPVNPGREGTVLTLSDGSKINLDSMSSGIIAIQQGQQVSMQHGKLIYLPGKAPENTKEQAYNTVTTPNGRQFSLILPDGSKVWLDAASTIRYPAIFAASERSVEVSGQAYFEVAANDLQPFRVQVKDGGEIAVLGTEFNISAYSQSVVKTTLITGKIRVAVPGGPLSAGVILLPAEQAMMQSGKTITVKKVNISQVTAWKRGFFHFEDAGIQEVLAQIARWYDIEIMFQGDVPAVKFSGQISRETSLSELLQILKGYGIHYQLNGRVLTILPASS